MDMHITLEGFLLTFSNFGLVLVTGLSIWLTLREDHRHSETETMLKDEHEVAMKKASYVKQAS